MSSLNRLLSKCPSHKAVAFSRLCLFSLSPVSSWSSEVPLSLEAGLTLGPCSYCIWKLHFFPLSPSLNCCSCTSRLAAHVHWVRSGLKTSALLLLTIFLNLNSQRLVGKARRSQVQSRWDVKTSLLGLCSSSGHMITQMEQTLDSA